MTTNPLIIRSIRQKGFTSKPRGINVCRRQRAAHALSVGFVHRVGQFMNPEIYRRFARRCRELMLLARTNAARMQLRVWADEFDEQASGLEKREEERAYRDPC